MRIRNVAKQHAWYDSLVACRLLVLSAGERPLEHEREGLTMSTPEDRRPKPSPLPISDPKPFDRNDTDTGRPAVTPPSEGTSPPIRRRRRTCPTPTPRERPSRVPKKAPHDGRCDYIDPEGDYCNHWQARGSEACPCHLEAYNQKHGIPMPTQKPRNGDVRKPKPKVFGMIRNELTKPPEWYQRS